VRVEHEYERVFLTGVGVPEGLVIGDFYGDPAAAAVDPAEAWCAVVGEGLIAYRIGPPWMPYWSAVGRMSARDARYLLRAREAGQWLEWGRSGGPADVVWLEGVVAEAPGRFRLHTRETERGPGGVLVARLSRERIEVSPEGTGGG